jgi:hypothetical protein
VHTNTCWCIHHSIDQMTFETRNGLLSILGLIFPSWRHVLPWLRASRT